MRHHLWTPGTGCTDAVGDSVVSSAVTEVLLLGLQFFQLRGKSWRTPPPNTMGVSMILHHDAIDANVWHDIDI